MPSSDDKAARLRNQAEGIVRERGVALRQLDQQLDAHAMHKALHELQVHQIELEMQNDELRTTQLALEVVGSRYQDLYDMAPVGYLTLGMNGDILHTNLKAASLLGLPRSQLVQKPLRRFVAKQDRDAHYLFTQQVLCKREPEQRDVLMVNAAGFEFWVRMAMSPQVEAAAVDVDVADEPLQLLVIINDITDRKVAEEKLYESEEVHRSLFNSIDEGFCIIEMVCNKAGKPMDFRYLATNPSFEKQSGLFGAQGRLASEVVPGLERKWIDLYGKVASTGKSVRFTDRAEVLNRWFDLFAFRTGPRDRPTVGVLFTDITQLKQTEADRRFLDEVLLHKNAELLDAQALAEKANRAKSDFLSGMSHELRTPLTAILGFAQLMDASNPAPTPGQKRSLEQILKAGWYLLDLINEILDLALIESGKMKLEMQSVSIAAVLMECEAMVELDAQRRGIRMQFDATPARAFVHADRTRLKQALINLLSNAIKYNNEGGSVRLSFNVESRTHLRICIEDTGKGLSTSQISQLFQPFNRLGQESRSEPGTGIGLVMTKQLVELMGGSIGMNSTVGKGSVFWIELQRDTQPLTQQTTQALVTAKVDPGQPFKARRSLAGLYTLLYVEDNAANLLLMQELMARRPDVRLLNAQDGITGLALARKALPDMILLDTHLPGLSGIDMLRILVSDPLTAAIPVVILSANAMPDEIQAGLEAGCSSYLTKPIHVKDLMRAINLALKLDQAHIDMGQLSQLGELT